MLLAWPTDVKLPRETPVTDCRVRRKHSQRKLSLVYSAGNPWLSPALDWPPRWTPRSPEVESPRRPLFTAACGLACPRVLPSRSHFCPNGPVIQAIGLPVTAEYGPVQPSMARVTGPCGSERSEDCSEPGVWRRAPINQKAGESRAFLVLFPGANLILG